MTSAEGAVGGGAGFPQCAGQARGGRGKPPGRGQAPPAAPRPRQRLRSRRLRPASTHSIAAFEKAAVCPPVAEGATVHSHVPWDPGAARADVPQSNGDSHFCHAADRPAAAPAQRRCDAGRSRPRRLCCSLILRALSGSHCSTSLPLGAECSEGRSSNPSVDLNIEGQSSEAARIYLRRKRRALWEAPVQAEAQECSEGETEAGAGGVFEEGEGTGTSVGGRRCYQCRKGHTVTLVLNAVFTFPSRGYWSGGNRSSGQCCFRPSPKAALSCPNVRKVGGGTRASQALGNGSSGAVLKWLCLFVCFFSCP